METLLDHVVLDRDPARTAAEDVFETLRSACLDGLLTPGSKLPSQRQLSRQLGLSRGVVSEALERLLDEGYVTTRHGAGTFVQTAPACPQAAPRTGTARRGPGLSARGDALAGAEMIRGDGEVKPLTPGITALDAFPWKTWSAHRRRAHSEGGNRLLGPADPQGDPALRTAIARHVSSMRGVSCDAGQVVIVPSARAAATLAGIALTDPGQRVGVENPGFPGATGGLMLAGAVPTPVPLDGSGMVPEAIPEGVRLIYITPSHQYPMGTVMPLDRRLALLDWARRQDAWIVEDDYDGEFRYEGKPISALYGLGGDHVLYVGTFSKSLFPALRLAYVIAPEPVARALTRAKTAFDGFCNPIDQRTLAHFMATGHFSRHIRRMRQLYAKRREAVIGACDRHLPKNCRVVGTDAGLHVTLLLPEGADDKALARHLAERGITPSALSRYHLAGPVRPGLVCGFANSDEATLEKAIRTVAEVISS